MIDLDELQAAINRCEFDGDVLGLSKAECSDLLGRLRQAEKDAARYRCIRSIAKVIECEEFDMDMLDGQDLDAMVDECIEAMQCK